MNRHQYYQNIKTSKTHPVHGDPVESVGLCVGLRLNHETCIIFIACSSWGCSRVDAQHLRDAAPVNLYRSAIQIILHTAVSANNRPTPCLNKTIFVLGQTKT